MKKLLILSLIALFSSISYAQKLDKEKLDLYFQNLENNNKFMGSVAISENGKIIYTNFVGYSDVETKTKPNENTKYRIGSISKSFTSVLIMKAIEENKISLTTKINHYFPEIKNAEKITISNLLNHRSGIHNFTDDESYLTWLTQKKSEKDLVTIIKNGGSDFEPDSKAEYSNSNYVLLSFILEKIYGKSYSDILNEKIIKPIGLKNTFLGKKIDLRNNESNSYKYENGWKKEPETDLSIPIGAGAIVSTPKDLLQFADALFNGKLITIKSLELMKEMNEHFGRGLFQITINDKKGFGHNGGIDGFSSDYIYFPAEKLAFAYTSNGKNYNISRDLINAILQQPYEIPSFTTITVKTEDLDQYLGTYSSKELPLLVTITKKDAVLIAQASGQSELPLDATAKNIFKFEKAGIVLEFDPAEKKMILKQGGKNFTFTKD